MTATQILEATAWTIEQGWCQRRYSLIRKGQPTRRCLIGAIRYVSNGVWLGATAQAMAALAKETGVEPFDLSNWNDAPGRTAEEVAATVRNAKRWL